MDTIGNKIKQKSATKYFCIFCNYKTVRKSNYDSHLVSTKHSKNADLETKGNKITGNQQEIGSQNYECEFCNKLFKHRSGLWKHNKKCKPSSNIITTELIIELIKDNQELKNIIKDNKELKNIIQEQNNKINHLFMNAQTTNILTNHIHNTNNTTNTNNSINKSFNLNLFLNETCKEAINISDFVNSIKVSFDDLENTGRKGYIEGITNIITKNLKKLEEHYRPIHCSDHKREVIYIKDNNKWEKETDSKPILTRAIKNIANENIRQIQGWREKYPDCTDADSKKNNMYLKIVSNSMNGLTEEESIKNINKIISNVSKETIIQKHNYQTNS